MATTTLPRHPLVISIAIAGDDGPAPNAHHTPQFLSYQKLDRDRVHQIAPDQVVSWLFCPAYDAYDVAHVLVAAGFRGRYLAVAGELPDSDAIAREIRACFPGLDFRLICPSRLSRAARIYHELITAAGLGAQLTPA